MGAVAATPPVQPGRIPNQHRALLPISGGVVLLTLLLAAWAGKPLLALLMLIDLGLVAFLTHRFLLQWHVLAAAIVLCILLIPINRYEFLGHMPFNLEPYRLLVAAVDRK